MRIRSFHIDAFGTLRDVTAEGLPEAGAVFLGHNEAGKSTLLDFFRSTLVGYPRTRDARERGYLAGQSGLLGGSLTLFSDARGGDIRLIRRPNVAKGEPLLTDAQGRPLDPALWERLLGGVTREVYASVYGFSLSELQSFASLTSEGVRNALYGASFGMAGLKSPGAALKKLTGSMEDLFRARGSNPRLSAALKEWEDVRRDMRRAEEDAARYDSLAAERDAAQGRLAALRAPSGSWNAGCWNAALESGSAGRNGASPGCALSGWSPCPRPSRRMAPRGWSGRWNAVRMRRGRWSRPGSGWNRPEKTWVPVWRIGLCWIAASGCANWPVGRLAAATRWRRFPGCAPIGSGRLPPCSANWPGSGRIGRLSASRGSGGLCRCVRHWNVRPSSGAAPFRIWKTRRPPYAALRRIQRRLSLSLRSR